MAATTTATAAVHTAERAGASPVALFRARSAWMCPVVKVGVVKVCVVVVRVVVDEVVLTVDVVVVDDTGFETPSRRKLNSWKSSQSTDRGRKRRSSWHTSCTLAVRDRSSPVSVTAAAVTAETMHCRSCSA